MKNITPRFLVLAALMVMATVPALAQVPKIDLIVQVREVDVGEGGGFTVGTQASKALLAPMQVRVLNGEKASLNVGKSLPMQWLKSASGQKSKLSSAGVSAESNGGSVSYEVTWVDVGQGIKVQPRWPGGQRPVTVDIEIQSASVPPRSGVELADQSRSQFATTVSTPLGKWATIAFTGSSPQSGVYGSEAEGDPRRLLQISVLDP